MGWALAVVAFLLMFLPATVQGPSRFPGLIPLIEVGPVKADWRDLIAIAIIAIVVWAIWTGQLSVNDALKILGGLLLGKAVSK